MADTPVRAFPCPDGAPQRRSQWPRVAIAALLALPACSSDPHCGPDSGDAWPSADLQTVDSAAPDLTTGSARPLVTFTSAFAPATTSGGSVTVPASGQPVRVDFSSYTPSAGTYLVSDPVVLNDPSGAWTVTLKSANPITSPSPGPDHVFSISVSAMPGTQSTVDQFLVVRVSSSTNTAVFGEAAVVLLAN